MSEHIKEPGFAVSLPKEGASLAFVSFGTAGTMGHMSLITRITEQVLKRTSNHVSIFSEYNYKDFSGLKSNNLDYVKIPKEEMKHSVAGSKDYEYSDLLLEELLECGSSHVFFSSFFDACLNEKLGEEGLKRYLISYPLRDTYLSIFYEEGFYDYFDKCILLKDISPIPFMDKLENTRLAELNLKDKRRSSFSDDQILIMMGGGGRPSANNFMQLVSNTINFMSEQHPDAYFKVLLGAYNNKNEDDYDLPNTEVVKWEENVQQEYEKSKFVISEAGFFTVHELLENQLPAILVPGFRNMDNQELRATHWEFKGLGYYALPTSQEEKLKRSAEKLYVNKRGLLEGMRRSSARVLEEKIKNDSIIEVLGV